MDMKSNQLAKLSLSQITICCQHRRGHRRRRHDRRKRPQIGSSCVRSRKATNANIDAGLQPLDRALHERRGHPKRQRITFDDAKQQSSSEARADHAPPHRRASLLLSSLPLTLRLSFSPRRSSQNRQKEKITSASSSMKADRKVDVTIDGKPFHFLHLAHTLKNRFSARSAPPMHHRHSRLSARTKRPGERIDHPHHAGSGSTTRT